MIRGAIEKDKQLQEGRAPKPLTLKETGFGIVQDARGIPCVSNMSASGIDNRYQNSSICELLKITIHQIATRWQKYLSC